MSRVASLVLALLVMALVLLPGNPAQGAADQAKPSQPAANQAKISQPAANQAKTSQPTAPAPGATPKGGGTMVKVPMPSIPGDLNDEESLLQKEFDSVPSSEAKTDGALDDSGDSSWMDEEKTDRDRDREKRLMQRIITTIFALLIVIVLIFIVLKFLSSGKISIPSLGIGRDSSLIRITDKKVLQPGKILYLVDLPDKNVLIGVSDNNISCLAEVSDEAIEKRRSEQSAPAIRQSNSDLTLFPRIGPAADKEDEKDEP